MNFSTSPPGCFEFAENFLAVEIVNTFFDLTIDPLLVIKKCYFLFYLEVVQRIRVLHGFIKGLQQRWQKNIQSIETKKRIFDRPQVGHPWKLAKGLLRGKTHKIITKKPFTFQNCPTKYNHSIVNLNSTTSRA